jgi:hypothetical protein
MSDFIVLMAGQLPGPTETINLIVGVYTPFLLLFGMLIGYTIGRDHGRCTKCPQKHTGD